MDYSKLRGHTEEPWKKVVIPMHDNCYDAVGILIGDTVHVLGDRKWGNNDANAALIAAAPALLAENKQLKEKLDDLEMVIENYRTRD